MTGVSTQVSKQERTQEAMGTASVRGGENFN